MNQAYGNTRLARQLVWFFAIFDAIVLFAVSCSAAAGGGSWLMVLLPLMAATVAVGVYAVRQGLLFEWRLERTWKRVCHGIGFKGEARSYRNGLNGAYRKGETKTIYPKLRNVHGTWDGWTGHITFFDGQTVEDYTKQADAFALAFHVPFVTFGIAESGLIQVRAGQVPVPDAYDHPGRLQAPPAAANAQVVSQVVPMVPSVYAHSNAHDVPDLSYELELLKGVPVARDLDGRECMIPIEGQHWLIAARTGGGKGSWTWSLVLGLEPAWRVGLVKFWGCDPKRLELAICPDCWEHYADNEEDIVKMLEQCVQEMFARARQLQGKARKFTPSPAMPLNIVVVDELGYLSAMLPDRKLRDRAEKAVSTILALGRAVGYSLVGAVQDPRKETVGFRDLFPIRIAGGLPGPMVDLVLGDGMHDAGAFCEQIPLGNAGAGVAYVISETTRKPVCVRSAWCDDLAIQGLLVEPAQKAIGSGNQVKDEPTGQLDWNGQPLGQFKYRTE